MITSFAVANAISVPLTGFLAKRFGEVKIFIAAVIGFVVTSWLCGIAHIFKPWFFSVIARLHRRAIDSLVPKPVDGFLSA